MTYGGCGLFFRCFLVLLCSSASVGLGFGVSLVVSVGFNRLGLRVSLGFVVVGVFFGAFRVLWVLLGCSAIFGLVLGLWVCKCSYTACVLGCFSLFL
jgi:hypothetical protein